MRFFIYWIVLIIILSAFSNCSNDEKKPVPKPIGSQDSIVFHQDVFYRAPEYYLRTWAARVGQEIVTAQGTEGELIFLRNDPTDFTSLRTTDRSGVYFHQIHGTFKFIADNKYQEYSKACYEVKAARRIGDSIALLQKVPVDSCK